MLLRTPSTGGCLTVFFCLVMAAFAMFFITLEPPAEAIRPEQENIQMLNPGGSNPQTDYSNSQTNLNNSQANLNNSSGQAIVMLAEAESTKTVAEAYDIYDPRLAEYEEIRDRQGYFGLVFMIGFVCLVIIFIVYAALKSR